MEAKGKLTILIGVESTSIDIEDTESGVVIARIKVSPIEFQKALSRIACVDCDVSYSNNNFDRIGKKMKIDTLFFPISATSTYAGNRKDIAREEVYKVCPKGWIPDLSFSSQDSFSERDGVVYAKTIIRTWE